MLQYTRYAIVYDCRALVIDFMLRRVRNRQRFYYYYYFTVHAWFVVSWFRFSNDLAELAGFSESSSIVQLPVR